MCRKMCELNGINIIWVDITLTTTRSSYDIELYFINKKKDFLWYKGESKITRNLVKDCIDQHGQYIMIKVWYIFLLLFNYTKVPIILICNLLPHKLYGEPNRYLYIHLCQPYST